ncbi:EpsG family protein [Metabacillus halosaccharovorans]|uniref:EpsG family protein n=1 Tax=Metabacillus halosaccharovorans TaxID=930124 RepID=UPI00403DBC5D
MTVLWINLILVFLLAFLSRFLSINVVLNGSGTLNNMQPNKLIALFSVIPLILVSGLRNNIGDTPFYMHTYNINEFTWEYIKSQDDIGFGILQMILKRYTEDPQVLIFTTAFITNLLIILVFYKYSKVVELSIFVYITGGLYLVTMNGIRQCLAAAIVFSATKFLLNGNKVKYILVIIFASFFHQSALILIPVYFLVRFKPWTKSTLILLSFSIIIVFGFNFFSTLLFAAIEDSQYGVYSNFNEGGASVIRVLVCSAPLIIAFIGREKLKEVFPQSDVFVNMALVGLCFMIISTANWIFARFNIYFELYQLVLVSWILQVFKEKDRKLVYYVLLVCYFAYYYFESVINLNIKYSSNYFG